MRVIFRWMLYLALLSGAVAWAQSGEDVGADFRRMSPQEMLQYRTILEQPVPSGVSQAILREHFRQKDSAARRISNPADYEAFLRQWAATLPEDWSAPLNLAGLLQGQRRFDEGIKQRLLAIKLAPSQALSGLGRVFLAFDYLEASRLPDAQKTLDDAVRNLQALSTSRSWPAYDQMFMARALGEAGRAQSLLHDRFGRWDPAVQSATESEAHVRRALKLAQGLPKTAAADREIYFALYSLGSTLARKTQALRAAGRLDEAELSLQSYLRLARESELLPAYLSGIYQVAANLRFSQREFAQSEIYARKSDKVLQDLLYEETHPFRTSRAQMLVAALGGQKRWADAAAEFERLDRLAGNDTALQRRVAFPFERGLTYIWTGKADRAVELFAGAAAFNANRYGKDHFYVIQSAGLQGVSLWRVGSAESRAKALPLLKLAVQGYMLPANADFIENVGFRRDVRDVIFSTYLEAMGTTAGEDATLALGPADWVRGGVVQEALADAAVRSAASDPALASLVRREQDAKNESQALRKYLQGEPGVSLSPLPEAAAQMRARLTELDVLRQGLQAQLKAGFPEYERLVRPQPSSGVDIARALADDEALLMLLPTDNAVYVWAVTSDKPAAFARVVLPQAALGQLVRSTRSTLDFAEMRGGMRAFDATASSELYQRLLQPLQSAFQGKKRLVVAAGGALGQLPFGVLLTAPAKLSSPADYAGAPWLIRQAAITQVPSISAWLAGKRLATAKAAPELLMGWGDPQFVADAVPIQAPAGATRHVVLTRASVLTDPDNDKPTAPGALRYGDIPSLPETRDELLAIASSLKADAGRDLRLGGRATRASVLQSNLSGELQKKKVLVFATHGLMAGDLPNLNQPALALAASSADGQDPLAPLLTLADVLGLKLNADWVVLSACNTAAADGKAEEALSGLARGFFYAGTRSLLVTHWAVESESARQLTATTFAHYAQNPQAPKAESLRQAMLAVMARPAYSHPAFWAPYALVGDGGR